MIEAYILLQIKPGMEILVRDEILSLKEVKEISRLYGEWDMIAKVVVNDLKELKEFVFKKVRTIKGVLDTSTLICAD